MRGNSQNGGQTTKSLLIKPQCSGVPIQQAVSLSSSFPRHCLLFVCTFFCEMQESVGSEEPPLLSGLLHTKPPRLPVAETGAVCLLYLCFWGRSRKTLRGFLIAAWAGAKITGRSESFFPFSLRVLLNASFCTEQHRLVMSFYFFYFHHTDGKHPIIAEVIVE